MNFDHSIDTINPDTATDPLRIGGTGGIQIPSGTTGERVAEDGIIRKNSTTGLLEYYDGASWINFADNADVEVLQRRVGSILTLDMNNADLVLTAEQSQYGYMTIINSGDGTKTLTIQDSPKNPSEYNFFIYSENPIYIENAAGNFSLQLRTGKNVQMLYSYVAGSPPAHIASLGDFALATDMDVTVRNVRSLLSVDMGAADYTCTLEESQYSGFVLSNVGDGLRTFKIQDSPENPTEYSVFIYDVNSVIFENEATSISESLLPFKIENMLYSYNGGSPVCARANFPVASYQTPSTGTKISVSNEGIVTNVDNATTADIDDSYNRRYVTESEKGIISGSLGGALFIQMTDPALATPYVWYKTDVSGNVIDILVGP